MFSIQVFLPLRSNAGTPFPRASFDQVSTTLTERFGGLTAYLRAPASGAWQDDEGHVKKDDLVVYEVLTDDLDRDWWSDYRKTLEELFRQEEIVVRAQKVWKL
jgi:hypothetical protein